MYKLLASGQISRLSDNAVIPTDTRNTDFKEYQQWLAAGNIPQPADPVPVEWPKLSARDFLALFTQEEKLAIKAATRANDEIGLWYDEMLASQFITGEDPDTGRGLMALLSGGLLTSARHSAITAALKPTT